MMASTNTATSIMSRLVVALLLLVSLVGRVKGRECGETWTKDCIDDPRYHEGGNNLDSQSDIWKRTGFYQVSYFQYEGNYAPDSEDTNRRFDYFPVISFVNITVKDTRYYFHFYGIIKDLITPSQSMAIYRDLYGHSTHEKDGTAKMLNERLVQPISYSTVTNGIYLDQELLEAKFHDNVMVPIGNSKSSRRTRFADVISHESGEVLVWDQLTCQEGFDCNTMTFTEEWFDQVGRRTRFASGTYAKMNETEWTQAILNAYETNEVPSVYRMEVPMKKCLADKLCPLDNEWCSSGDPSCSLSPYQQDDGELRGGAIAAIVIFSLIVAALGLFFLWRVYLTMKERRYRTHFISRFSEDVSLQKPMKDITPENMTREFNFIVKSHESFITKGELFDFMMTSKLTSKIKDSDFSALWETMDINKNGTIDYVEFCAFTADCYEEHSTLRNKLVLDAKKAAGS